MSVSVSNILILDHSFVRRLKNDLAARFDPRAMRYRQNSESLFFKMEALFLKMEALFFKMEALFLKMEA